MDKTREMLFDIFKDTVKETLTLSQEMNVSRYAKISEITIKFKHIDSEHDETFDKLKCFFEMVLEDVRNDRRGDNADSKIGTV